MKKLHFSTLMILATGLLLFLGNSTTHGADLGTFEDIFPDSQLATSVAANRSKQPGDIMTTTDVANILVLDCSGLGIEDLTGIGTLTSLERFAAGNNGIAELPAELFTLSNLTYLDLSFNLIEEIPVAISDLSFLEELHLDANESISTVPDSICDLSNLLRLTLSGTSIATLPDNIGDLTSLTDLSLLQDYIVELPDSICSLVNLEYLGLSENELVALPENIGQLTSLTDLEVDMNYLTSLPVSMADLENLEYFDFYDNQLKDIPPAVYNWLYTLYYDYGMEGYIDTQACEETISETGVVDVDYGLPAFPIYQQVLDFYDEPILTFELTLPDNSVEPFDPVFNGTALVIPGYLLTQVGTYHLNVYTDGFVPMAVNRPNESEFFYDVTYVQTFWIVAAEGPTDPADPADPTDPGEPADPTNVPNPTEKALAILPQTGGYSMVGLGLAALATGGLLLVYKGRRP